MSTVKLMPEPKIQFFSNNGIPLAGGMLYTYAPGTYNNKATYTDSTGTSQNTNPVVLDAAGRAGVWLNGYYDMVLTDSLGSQIWSVQNVSAIPGGASTIYNASDYASLNAAVTAIGATPATLLINTANFTVTAPVTVPSTLSLQAQYPGTLSIAGNALAINSAVSNLIISGTGAASVSFGSTVNDVTISGVTSASFAGNATYTYATIAATSTITFNAAFSSSLYQVFTSTGVVTGLKTAYPELFYTGSSNWGPAINSCWTAAPLTILQDNVTYNIATQLVVSSNTHMMGKGILKWTGANNVNIIIDSSKITNTNINSNIFFEDFELNCNSYANGSTTVGIFFYRVFNVVLRNLYVHDAGNTLLVWGVSQIDTTNILIDGGRYVRAYTGDCVSGAGSNVLVRGVYSQSMGDTGFAVLSDNTTLTNSSNLMPQYITFESCTAVGDWNSSGVYAGGSSHSTQLGFAFGGYSPTQFNYFKVVNCTTQGLYAGLSATTMNYLELGNNQFKFHANTTGPNILLNGVGYFTITGGTMENKYGGNYGALALNSGTISSLVSPMINGTVSGVKFICTTNVGIQLNVDTTTSTSNLIIGSNIFSAATILHYFTGAGSGTNLYQNIDIEQSLYDTSATYYAYFGGVGTSLYKNISVRYSSDKNFLPLAGAYLDSWLTGSFHITPVSAVTATATPLYTLTGSLKTMYLTAYYAISNVAYTAYAVIGWNLSVPYIISQVNGANMTLTLVGNVIKGTQSSGATQNIEMIVSIP